ncbi:MAG: hypothetical protein F2914_03070, partial [Actinobacteria bacterium]|nr:hypothetical protein [Actinomycetota bacterium]
MEQDDSDSKQSPINQTPAPPRTPTQTPAVRFDPAELLDQDITLEEMLSQAGSGAGHGELVQLPQEEPRNPDALDDRRRSDVNEWGRSEHMREI